MTVNPSTIGELLQFRLNANTCVYVPSGQGSVTLTPYILIVLPGPNDILSASVHQGRTGWGFYLYFLHPISR